MKNNLKVLFSILIGLLVFDGSCQQLNKNVYEDFQYANSNFILKTFMSDRNSEYSQICSVLLSEVDNQNMSISKSTLQDLDEASRYSFKTATFPLAGMDVFNNEVASPFIEILNRIRTKNELSEINAEDEKTNLKLNIGIYLSETDSLKKLNVESLIRLKLLWLYFQTTELVYQQHGMRFLSKNDLISKSAINSKLTKEIQTLLITEIETINKCTFDRISGQIEDIEWLIKERGNQESETYNLELIEANYKIINLLLIKEMSQEYFSFLKTNLGGYLTNWASYSEVNGLDSYNKRQEESMIKKMVSVGIELGLPEKRPLIFECINSSLLLSMNVFVGTQMGMVGSTGFRLKNR